MYFWRGVETIDGFVCGETVVNVVPERFDFFAEGDVPGIGKKPLIYADDR
jgi:hypothetical protein